MAVLDPSRRRIGAYLALWLVLVLALAAGLAAAAVAVDPYYYFGAAPRPGINVTKPRAEQRLNLAKRAQLPRICGRTLVTGNSRMENGIDPASAFWPPEMRPVFNAATAGAGGAAGQAAMLALALETCPPRQLFASVDFFDVMIARPPPSAAAPPGPEPLLTLPPRVATLVDTTLSLDVLWDVGRTLAAQGNPDSPHLRPDGLNPLADAAALIRQIGHHRLFVQKNADYRARLVRNAMQPLDPRTGPEMADLVALLERARAGGVAVVLAIPPYHASLRDVIRAEGLEPRYAAWKAALGHLAGAARGRGLAVRLFDFAADDPRSAEMVPPPEDRTTRMRWYWESGHFTTALGDLMVARVAGTTPAGELPFGVELPLP